MLQDRNQITCIGSHRPEERRRASAGGRWASGGTSGALTCSQCSAATHAHAQRGCVWCPLLNCCSRFSTAPPRCCCTVMHYDGGLRFSSISPGCNELGGGRGPPALPSGVVQEFGPPGWVAPITAMEGSSRGGPGWPRPAGSYWEFSSLEMSRSSSSPNSPPIRLGSPTTITS